MTTYRPDPTTGAASGLRAAAALSTLARNLAETSGVLPTLHEIAAQSVELVPCDWAAVAVGERFTSKPARLASSTDDELMATVSAVAGEAGRSPGIAAFETGVLVRCDDLFDEPRFAEYAAAIVARTPIRAVMSIPLRLNDTTLGVLTVYSAQPHVFDALAESRATLVAEHAAVAVEAARSGDRAEHLELALEHSRTIGAAIGILVERHRILPDEAFQRLRETSQHHNRKLADVAADLVETGTLPED
jgi:GAF domain-containing protein